MVVIPSLLSAVVLRNTLLLRVLEIAVVTKTGAPASRMRVLWRSIVLWGIVLLAIGILAFALFEFGLKVTFFAVPYLLVVMFVHDRGLHEIIAGTTLVPR